MGMACALLVGAAMAQSTTAVQAPTPGDPQRGLRIMVDGTGGNCVACHALPGQSGLASTFAPSLDKVALRYSAEVLRQWVNDARQLKPDTLMPPMGSTANTQRPVVSRPVLTPQEIDHVVAALLTLR